MAPDKFENKGLTAAQVEESRARFGSNILQSTGKRTFRIILRSIIKEPMFVLLVSACTLYLLLGEYTQGLLMLVAIALISGISFYQEVRSESALEALRELYQPLVKVIRDGRRYKIPVQELVVGDIMIIEEGQRISADAIILSSNDFSVDESILTGESFPIEKNAEEKNNLVFLGATVASGNATTRITATGTNTRLGLIGKTMEHISSEPTHLQLQINRFVRVMALFGIIAFFVVWAINFLMSGRLFESLLFGLTLAMSALPEEIPVAFASFMALGAWRMIRYKVLVKNPQTVEALGAASVICLDKTGTITEDYMQVTFVFDHQSQTLAPPDGNLSPFGQEVLSYAMWASETEPFDIMEKAIHDAYSVYGGEDLRPLFQKTHEYPLAGRPPMMTHVFEKAQGERIIAAKGGPETILRISSLNNDEISKIFSQVQNLGRQGFRVLGVAKADYQGNQFPANQEDFAWQFLGLVTLYNPAKKNIPEVLRSFYDAGIKVKIVTGDFAETTQAVAREIGLRGADRIISGEQIAAIAENELPEVIDSTIIFMRMYPEVKVKVVNILKAKGEVVTMMGDGVNDGPALKAAHIGIAMGKKGTDLAKRAASLILLEDNLARVVDAISLGRKIYTNLNKAVRYIISIHIPIILVVVMPLLLGWKYPNIFSPIHVIFLELVMGPTCSIVFENEPMEQDTMKRKPRKLKATFLSTKELALSITQGLMISAGVLGMYYYSVHKGQSIETARTLVFATLVLSNIFLTLVNRSFFHSALKTLGYRNNLMPLALGVTLLIWALALIIPPVRSVFMFEPVSGESLIWCAIVAFLSVGWVEIVKWIRRANAQTTKSSV